MDSQLRYFSCTVLFSLLYIGYLVRAEDGAKYCPKVENKEETTFVIGESCYHYVERPDVDMLSFAFAARDCKSNGGQLMVVRNKELQDTIYSRLNMRYADSHSILIGLQKHGSSWKWVDGSAVGYTNWNNRYNGTLNCARMNLKEKGLWEEFDCAVPEWYHAYVCEYHKYSSSNGSHLTSFGVLIATIMSLLASVIISQ